VWRFINWCLLCGLREQNGPSDLCAHCEGDFATTLKILEEEANG